MDKGRRVQSARSSTASRRYHPPGRRGWPRPSVRAPLRLGAALGLLQGGVPALVPVDQGLLQQVDRPLQPLQFVSDGRHSPKPAPAAPIPAATPLRSAAARGRTGRRASVWPVRPAVNLRACLRSRRAERSCAAPKRAACRLTDRWPAGKVGRRAGIGGRLARGAGVARSPAPARPRIFADLPRGGVAGTRAGRPAHRGSPRSRDDGDPPIRRPRRPPFALPAEVTARGRTLTMTVFVRPPRPIPTTPSPGPRRSRRHGQRPCAPSRWMRWRRRNPATPACRWAWPTWRRCCSRGS